MRSLQIVTPHMKCMYNCPFCISKAHTHHNQYEDNYTNNYALYEENLVRTLMDNPDLKYVVITGTNEPMQSRNCVRDIINIVRQTRNDIQIELQTRYYHPDELYDYLDVVAYSISNPKAIKAIKPKGKIQRYVFILTSLFNNYKLEDIINMIPSTVSQLTFKVLQDSSGDNPEFDEYIRTHSADANTLNNLKHDIENYQGNLSVRFDSNCMVSEGRYEIFREDGNVYANWTALEPEKRMTK